MSGNCASTASMADQAVSGLIDEKRLVAWLDAYAPELGDGPLEACFLHGGTSNIIIALQRSGPPAVLRRPPLVPPPNSERAMIREARVLHALRDTDVPHPHLYGLCEDVSIIGAPFYVMERVAGWAADLGDEDCFYHAPFDLPANKPALTFAMIDALAALHKVDYRSVGLADFGRPNGFLERQVTRWRRQLESYPKRYSGYMARDIPGFAKVASWLEDNVAPAQQPAIVHGDFGPPNLLFGHGLPARVAAIIDWELATIGDPLMDITLLGINLRDQARPEEIPRAAYFNSQDFPTRQKVFAYYAEKTGRDLGHMDYYLTLVQFRLACILEYKVAASLTGQLPQSVHEKFAPMVLGLMADAYERVQKLA
jgi:aminoglycoside phosphotransferase (APT) family kinase protein